MRTRAGPFVCLSRERAERPNRGGGVPQAAYADDAYDGMARFTRAWFDHRLAGDWLPALPDLQQRLQTGVRWADVGSGADVSVLRVDRGKFGFVDSAGAKKSGNQSIICEMTPPCVV